MDYKKWIVRTAILVIAFFSIVSCDDDFNEVGTSLVDHDNFKAQMYTNAALEAHSVKIKGVQSNGLSSYALGYYKDPKYGGSSANILTQLKLQKENPSFGTNPQLDSVVLVIPYFSTVTSQDFFHKEYALDSVYGNQPIKLSIYRSDFYLRQFDPNRNYKPQRYFSNQTDEITQHLTGTPLYSNNSFTPSDQQIVLTTPGVSSDTPDTTKLAPALRVKLPKEKFKQLILENEGSSVLLTNSNFQDFFRGLYFKVEPVNNKGTFMLLNFKAKRAGITLYFHHGIENSDGEEQQLNDTFKLEFGSEIVNLFTTDYQQLPATDDNLYVKGGQGSLAVIDLFTNPAQLDSLRQEHWLINEANLKLYVNKEALPADQVNPERVFIYDIKNKKVLTDYTLDGGERDNDILNSRTTHLGRLQTDEEGNTYYTIKITHYINDIINNDSTNTKLGLVISQNVNINTQSKVETVSGDIPTVPTCEVLARNGTVFYGPEASSDKALKLEIYYTKED